MRYKNEKQLVAIIKYTLPIFVLSISIAITTFLYFEKKDKFKIIKEEIQENFIKSQKQVVKQQVENLYEYIIREQKSTEKALKKELKDRTYEIHKLTSDIYNHYKNSHSKEEITQIIRTAIKSIRFNNNRGYFFIVNKKGVNIVHPLLPQLEGKNLINVKDIKGTYIVKESLELLTKHEEGFQEYFWRKSKNDTKEYRKIGFIKSLDELDWYIGTGEYIDDFTKDIKKQTLEQIERFRYGENSYFIVTDSENNYISHINKKLIGVNALQKLKEMNDINSIKKIEKVINTKEGYVYLEFFKPNSTLLSAKIIYLKTIPKWGWVISTGFYKDDANKIIDIEKNKLEKQYNNNLKNLIVIAFILTSIFTLISFYISLMIENKFKEYKGDIQKHEDENRKQYEILSQRSKLAAMGEMIGNIAHQWRQPLSVISTASSGIKLHKEMDSLSDELLIDSMDNITESVQYLSTTIDDFREFFKPDKEQQKFTLKSAINKTLKLLSSRLKNNEIEIIQNIEEIEIDSYKSELIQVLINLIHNAKDAFEKCEHTKLLFINVFKKENKIFIEIKDNAGGIEEEIMKRVFEPYFTTKHQSQGTGIGLYMSEEIITKHMEGKIYVSNTTFTYNKINYKGALFTIELDCTH